ncbi:hypothetical protein CJU90_3011 [Yarrowia sp. C11]|nr:hypothetical protein CKK34_4461 [Yarrowia sp. E02]KAG5369552.1 hypothetical protein CJU90_3011 [Yarrowia sp. C11]
MLSSTSAGYDTSLRAYDTTPVTQENLHIHNQQLADSLESCLREIELLKLELHLKELRIQELEALNGTSVVANTEAATASMSCLTLSSGESETKEFAQLGVLMMGEGAGIPAELVPDFLGFSLQEFLDE